MEDAPAQGAKELSQRQESGCVLSPEDENALKDFCAALNNVEEVSLDAWSEAHSQLNLIIPLFLSASEARDGIVRQIFYTRTITRQQLPQKVVSKIKTTCEVVIEPGTTAGAKIVMQGLGDCCGELMGDLIITVCFK